MLIDWHAHHTPPELGSAFERRGARPPRPHPFDSPDFSRRVAEMDAVGIDFQIVSQGAGVNADRLPPADAIAIVRQSNDLIAERTSSHRDRLAGSIAFTWVNPIESAAEIRRMAAAGFRAVMMYGRGDVMGDPAVEPVFRAISEVGLPVFLHGGAAAAAKDPTLERLEDAGQGVVVSASADAAVSDCVVRMIAAGLFDRYPHLQVVIRSSGGGIPLLLSKLWWKHKGPGGEERYADVLLRHFSVDCASAQPRTLRFLLDTLGADRVVFGSDYCGGLGPLAKALPVINEQPDPSQITRAMERNSRALLHL